MSHARWAFPLYAVVTLILVVSELYSYAHTGEMRGPTQLMLVTHVIVTIIYWTHWSGRAFRKKAARARVVSRPKR